MTHKNIYKIIVGWFFLLPLASFAQDVNQNWVKQIAYKVATGTPIANPTAAQAQVNVTYLDGLGRPVMQIANKQSNTGKDIVVPIEYDDFGRTTKQYMPYVATNDSIKYTDYNGQDINTIVAPSYPQFGSQNFYSETLYEASPLHRVLKQAAPGTTDNWAMGSGHEIKYAYQANTDNDFVRKFSVSSSGQLSDEGFYTANELYKTIVYNENSETDPGLDTDHATITFTNLRGQVVLKRTYANSMVDSLLADDVQHDTYNVYDVYGNLTFVIPPLVTDVTTQLGTLCYQYKYDEYNRLIEKKTPDKTNWENIVYDRLNRIVATGPVASPFGDGAIGYMLTRYDNLNRVCYTGWYPTLDNRQTIQNLYNGEITNVAKTASDVTIDAKGVRYTSVNLPSNFKLLSINYYDDYNFTNAPTEYTSTADFPVYYNNSTKIPKGLPTGSWTRTLISGATPIGETSYVLYDYRARHITSKITNHLGGYTESKSKLDFASKTLFITTTHKRSSTQTGTVPLLTITTTDSFYYSDQGRLIKHTKLNNNDQVEVLSEPIYNELGQVVTKFVGGLESSSTRLQKVDYTYNIRGWMTNINDVNTTMETTQTGAYSDLFASGIKYEENNIVAGYPGENLVPRLYNGSISETYWRTSSDNNLRKYGYRYDNLNRLTSAFYQKPNQTSMVNAYGEAVSYDKNGNIKTLQRNGDFDSQTQAIPIDNLNYQYIANTNKLLNVSDSSNSSLGFKNGSNTDNDYSYDDFGNLLQDKNKGISTAIKYNHLNLPTEIIFATTPSIKKINYIYNAAGDKLQKIVTQGSNIKTTDYLSGFQYENALLKFYSTSEGYVNYDTGYYKYVYNYLDHLGNIRLSYTSNATNTGVVIMEENHYYAYGLKHTNYNTTVLKFRGPDTQATATGINRYKYNGKEWQNELGLNVTDMDFRQYDNAIGRFVCIDPITHFSQSPYHFANNNPIAYNDPTGLDGGYALSWASNTAYLNSSLGSSNNWGQSAVGGSSIDYISNFESSAFSTTNTSVIAGIMGYYARESGYTGFSYMYADSENNIHGLGAGFYQYSKSGNGINGLGNGLDNFQTAGYFTGDRASGLQAFNLGISFYGFGASIVQSRLLRDQLFYENKGTQTALRYIAKEISPSLNNIGKISKGLGIIGVGLSVAGVVNDFHQGKDLKASQIFDVALSATLAFVAVSNPVGLVALGVYGLLDAGGAFDGIKSYLGGDTVIYQSPF